MNTLSAANDPEFYPGKYTRIIVIASLDTVINAPVLLFCIVQRIVLGGEATRHNSQLGPHLSAYKTILQVPASEWGAGRRGILDVKWTEWVYVVHAIIFFAVFGTTPAMVRGYRDVLAFIGGKMGFTRGVEEERQELSKITFKSNPRAGNLSNGNM